MRVLVYVEPHPIRGKMTHFADPARDFLGLARATRDADVRLYANDETLDVLAAELPQEEQHRLLRPTAGEEALFRAELGDWNASRIARW